MYGWPDSGRLVAAFRPLAEHSPAPCSSRPFPGPLLLGLRRAMAALVEHLAITLPTATPSASRTASPAQAYPTTTPADQPGLFVLVALNSATTPGLDREITEAMQTAIATTRHFGPVQHKLLLRPLRHLETYRHSGGLVSAVAAPGRHRDRGLSSRSRRATPSGILRIGERSRS